MAKGKATSDYIFNKAKNEQMQEMIGQIDITKGNIAVIYDILHNISDYNDTCWESRNNTMNMINDIWNCMNELTERINNIETRINQYMPENKDDDSNKEWESN